MLKVLLLLLTLQHRLLLVVLRVYLRAVVGGFEVAGSSRREAAILLLATDVLLAPLQQFQSTSARTPTPHTKSDYCIRCQASPEATMKILPCLHKAWRRLRAADGRQADLVAG